MTARGTHDAHDERVSAWLKNVLRKTAIAAIRPGFLQRGACCRMHQLRNAACRVSLRHAFQRLCGRQMEFDVLNSLRCYARITELTLSEAVTLLNKRLADGNGAWHRDGVKPDVNPRLALHGVQQLGLSGTYADVLNARPPPEQALRLQNIGGASLAAVLQLTPSVTSLDLSCTS